MRENNTFDKTVSMLCTRIDNLEYEVDHWKTKYENEVKQQAIDSKERMEEAQKGLANALMFALSVRDDEHGNLVIGKEEREELAANWK